MSVDLSSSPRIALHPSATSVPSVSSGYSCNSALRPNERASLKHWGWYGSSMGHPMLHWNPGALCLSSNGWVYDRTFHTAQIRISRIYLEDPFSSNCYSNLVKKSTFLHGLSMVIPLKWANSQAHHGRARNPICNASSSVTCQTTKQANWRYLPHVRPVFQGNVREHSSKVWPEIWY